LLVLVHLK